MTIQADRTLAKTTPRAAFSRVRLLVSAVAWVVAPLLAVGCSDSGRRSLTPQQTADAGVSEQDSGTTDDAGQSKPPLSLPQCSQALDRSTATVFYDAARCLFEGADAPQEGVATGTINPERVAVVRGRLLDAAGSPLVGAKVTVLKHSEFGSTESRWDGYFDMAVNGGDALTLRFQKDSFLMSQRHVQTVWRQFGVVPDVVLLAQPSASTTVELTSGEPSIIRGDKVNDTSGERRNVVFVPTGTTATLTMPDGSSKDLSSFHVHVAEYTVGDRGPQAMPGDLPASSGYTYAIEYSVDEAESANAQSVQFSSPVVGYVENFLHFPVGTAVPLGTFDPNQDVWKASDSGLIVQVTSTAGGIAQLDVNGDGTAEDEASLAALGVTEAELKFLASEYQANDSLWRFPVSHFSAWDCNWPYGPPADATAPSSWLDVLSDLDCKTRVSGSIIGCEDQTLGEAIPIAGTPYSLHYQSERTPGRKDNRQVAIHLTGATIPGSLKRIELEVEVLGKTTTQSFQPTANAHTTFVWDGLDPYGRQWQGRQVAHVSVGYVYDGAYQSTNLFGYSGNGVPITGDKTRQEVTLWQKSQAFVGGFDATPATIGAWSVNAVHTYDTQGHVVYYGDGHRRSAEQLSDVINTVAGNGSAKTGGDGGPAVNASLYSPMGLVVAGDGTLYIAQYDSRVRRVTPDGVISTFAGSGDVGNDGDGGPATSATFRNPWGLALGRDGTLYIVDSSNYNVRAVRPDGIIVTVAGGGKPTTGNGDGGLATAAILSEPYDVAVGPDGSLFIADFGDSKVRRVAPDGTISTYVGTGNCSETGDGGPASAATICAPTSVAVNSKGELYVSDWLSGHVRKVDTSGTITTVFGGGSDEAKQGATATDVQGPVISGISLGPDGTLYIATDVSGQVLHVTQAGTIDIAAGIESCTSGPLGDGGPPDQACFGGVSDVYVDTNGFIWVADGKAPRVRRITQSLPNFPSGEISIASEDGAVVDMFSDHGRHLRTVDALSGITLLSFSYDSAGHLTAIKDRDGNATSIAYDDKGTPTTITTPFGQNTSLEVNSDGYLSSVTNPNNETESFTYTTGGLLSTLTEPRGSQDTHKFEYDDLGRLTKDTEPSGSFQYLARTDNATYYSVTHSTKLGRTRTHTVTPDATGGSTRTVVQEDGTSTTSTLGLAQSVIQTPTSKTTVTYGGDPRFGMQSPLAATVQIDASDSSSSSKIDHSRTVQLANPIDPLSIQKVADTITINGRAYQTVWDTTARTSTTTSPEGRNTVTTFDSLGHVIKRQVGNLEPASYTVDSNGRVIAVLRGTRTTSFSYDPSSWLASISNPLGQSTTFAHDPVGRVTGITEPDQNKIASSFDLNGNLLGITPSGRGSHNFSYAAGDLLDSYVPPALSGSTNTSTKYTYNGDDQIATITRPDGSTLSATYDSSSGHLSQLTFADGSISYTYSTTTGQLSSLTAPDAKASYSYHGNLLAGTSWSGPFSSTYSQNINDDLQVVSDSAAGSSVSYTYDKDGLVLTAGTETITRDTQTALITGTALGTIVDGYTYDNCGDLSEYQASIGSSALYDVQITRDDLGRIATRNETIQGTSHNDSFAYDSLGRLTQVTRDGVTTATYAYDANGNRTSVETTNTLENAAFDAQDRLVTAGSTNCTYSSNGELLQKQQGTDTTALTYNGLGLLKKVVMPSGKIIEYLLDGEGRRIGKKVNGTLAQGWLYKDALAPVAAVDANGTLQQRYVFASRSQVPDFMTQGTNTYRIIADERGSVRLAVDTSTGEVKQRLDYDAWGNVTQNSNPGFQPFGFAGGLYDSDTGLVHFGVREYDSTVGRWLSKDPILFNGGQANIYVYVGNDPVNYFDPVGAAGVATAIVGGLVGGAAAVAGTALTGDTSLHGLGTAGAVGFVGGAIGGFFDPGSGASAGLGVVAGITGAKLGGGGFGSLLLGGIGGGLGGAVGGLVPGYQSILVGNLVGFPLGMSAALVGAEVDKRLNESPCP